MLFRSKDRYEKQKLDHDMEWHSFKGYEADLHGHEIGFVQVPGTIKFVHFWMDGPDDDDTYFACGEMHPTNYHKMALAAYNHGCNEVVLFRNKPWDALTPSRKRLA